MELQRNSRHNMCHAVYKDIKEGKDMKKLLEVFLEVLDGQYEHLFPWNVINTYVLITVRGISVKVSLMVDFVSKWQVRSVNRRKRVKEYFSSRMWMFQPGGQPVPYNSVK